ncbi:MAG TPA: MFS transporter [Candidatus Omnitrophota bacterium]|nr:MFS transporter [Candidatus Omnitrophota bacterium]HPT07045.1 MFS transporter [Candidatus Omnitrophota bacterium]
MNKRTFFLLCLEGALLSFNVAASAALVPSIAAEFGVSQFIAGRIIWLYMLPYGLAALFYGPLIRAIDAKKVELVCLILFSLANLLVGVSNSIGMLFAGRLLMGVFGASVIPLGIILIGRHITPLRRGRAVGIFFGGTFSASLAGLVLSGIIPWRLIYIAPAIAGFILVIFLWIYLPSFQQDVTRFSCNYRKVFANANVARVFLYIFLISIFYHGVQQWLAVYFSKKFGFSQFVISMLVMATSLSGIFGEVIGGFCADTLGRIKTANIGSLIMILTVAAVLMKLPLAVIGIVMLAWGFGWTLNHAGISTILTDLPHDHLHESASLNSSLRFIAGGIGAAWGGYLMQFDIHLGFIVFGVCVAGLLVCTKPLLKKA